MADESKPKRPEEDVEFDYGVLDESVTEELADFDAEETNAKEVKE